MQPYKTVAEYAEDEFTEKRSRFLCAITPISTAQECADFIARRRAEHHDARHTVYAYRLRDGTERYSDDGEPQGTGGQPMLEVLRRNDLTDVCAAVTRYFGGVLLGAGGLTRAYANGAVLAIGAAKIVTMQPCALCTVAADYARYALVTRIAEKHSARVLDTDFAEQVTLSLQLPAGEMSPFSDDLREATGGSIAALQTGEVFGAV